MNEEVVENTDANNSKEAPKPETMTRDEVETLVKNIIAKHGDLMERKAFFVLQIENKRKDINKYIKSRIFTKSVSEWEIERAIDSIVEYSGIINKFDKEIDELMHVKNSINSGNQQATPGFPQGEYMKREQMRQMGNHNDFIMRQRGY